MEKEVQKWYSEGCDFYEGVIMLQDAGADVQAFLPYMSESYIPRVKQDLLVDAVLNFDFSRTITYKSQPKVQNTSKEHPTIIELRNKARSLHKLHADRHSQLHIEPDEAKRLVLIIEIMEVIIPSLDNIYDSIREYERTGALPVIANSQSPIPNPLNYETGLRDGVMKFQRLQNLKSRISKLDGKNGLIEKETDSVRKQKLNEELSHKLKERDALLLELNLTEHE